MNNTKQSQTVFSVHSQMLQKTQIQHLPIHNIVTIASYLNIEELAVLESAIGAAEGAEEKFMNVSNCIRVFRQYIDVADKSIYFGVFQGKEYLRLHQDVITKIAFQEAKIFRHFSLLFQSTLQCIAASVSQNMRPQFQQTVKLLFLDPSMPMPKMLRQTVAPRANSPLQNFLLSKLQPCPQHPFEPILAQLSQTFSTQQQKHLNKIWTNRQKYHSLFHNAHKLSYKSIQTANNCDEHEHEYQERETDTETQINLYNLLVGLFSMTDLYLCAIEEFCDSVQDQAELYLEMLARWNVFVGVVVGVEDGFGEIFKGFDCLYQELFGVEGSFCYWKPALSMWLSKMHKFFKKTNKIQHILTSQLIHTQTQQTISKQKYNQIFSTFSMLSVEACLSSASSHSGHKWEQAKSQFLPMLMEDTTQLLIYVNSYQEMIIDLSLDETSLLYCGHSLQNLGPVYRGYETGVIHTELSLINQLKKLTTISKDQQQLINQISTSRLSYLHQLLKPTTLTKIEHLYSTFLPSLPSHNRSQTDCQIAHYINYLQQRKPSTWITNTKSIWDLAFNSSDVPFNERKVNSIDTFDTQNEGFDQSFQFYQSEQEEEEGGEEQQSRLVWSQ